MDEALRKSDMRAQSEALGLALRNGRPTGSASIRDGQEQRFWEVTVWRVRGLLWWTSLGLRVRQVVFDRLDGSHLRFTLPYIGSNTMMVFHFVSILWIAWNPYWLRAVRARGRIKLIGHDTWIRNMLIVYCLRGLSTMLPIPASELAQTLLVAMEAPLLVHAFLSLRAAAPIAIQLVRPVSVDVVRPASPARPLSTPDSRAKVKEIASSGSPRANPIFGQPSLAPHTDQGEPMDWEPIQSLRNHTGRNLDDADEGRLLPQQGDWDNFGIGKQRMFDRATQETGLESLLASWGLGTAAPEKTRLLPAEVAGPAWRTRIHLGLKIALLFLGAGRLAYAGLGRYHGVYGSTMSKPREYGLGGIESALSLLRMMLEEGTTDISKRSRVLSAGVSVARCALLLSVDRWTSPTVSSAIFGMLDMCDACG